MNGSGRLILSSSHSIDTVITISTFPGHDGHRNTQVHPLVFERYNFGFLRVACFLIVCRHYLLGAGAGWAVRACFPPTHTKTPGEWQWWWNAESGRKGFGFCFISFWKTNESRQMFIWRNDFKNRDKEKERQVWLRSSRRQVMWDACFARALGRAAFVFLDTSQLLCFRRLGQGALETAVSIIGQTEYFHRPSKMQLRVTLQGAPREAFL